MSNLDLYHVQLLKCSTSTHVCFEGKFATNRRSRNVSYNNLENFSSSENPDLEIISKLESEDVFRRHARNSR